MCCSYLQVQASSLNELSLWVQWLGCEPVIAVLGELDGLAFLGRENT